MTIDGVPEELPLSLSHRAGSPVAALLAAARRIGLSGASAVICGEPGTGKEELAHVIHGARAPSGAPPVVHTRGRDAEAVAEALFGGSNPAALRQASGETLLLDEVAELSWELQGRLALAIARQPAVRAAGLRLVATSTRELLPLVNAGAFRRDLYDAFSCSLRVPPLRERRDDVLAVVGRAWEALGERRVIAEGALELLRQYSWPGNAGEVIAFTRRIAANVGAPTISVRDVERELFMAVTGLSCWGPPEPTRPAAGGVAGGEEPASAFRRVVAEAGRSFAGEDRVDLTAALRAIECGLVDWALERAGGSKAVAAELLGIRRTTLVEKLRRRRERPARPPGPPSPVAEALAPAPAARHEGPGDDAGGAREGARDA